MRPNQTLTAAEPQQAHAAHYAANDLLASQTALAPNRSRPEGDPAGSYIAALLRDPRMPAVTTLDSIRAAPISARRAVMDEDAALLLERPDRNWIVSSHADYECRGDVANVAFPCDRTIGADGDAIHLPDGATDTCIALATESGREHLAWLARKGHGPRC